MDEIIGIIVTTIIVLLIIIIGAIVVLVNIGSNLYGGKTIHCVEDNGAEWTATISNNNNDFLWYFSNDDGIKFKSTDNRLMQCRGSYEEIIEEE